MLHRARPSAGAFAFGPFVPFARIGMNLGMHPDDRWDSNPM